MARNPALTRYDNNTPYDCTLAGEKQGSQEQFGRGATPDEICNQQKKYDDFEVNADNSNYGWSANIIINYQAVI